jgi:hypothetical protein
MRYDARMFSSPSEAIALLGGHKILSGRIQRPLTTVASWATREAIPVEVWSKLIDLAKARGVEGVTYETLARAHAPARPGKRKRRAA